MKIADKVLTKMQKARQNKLVDFTQFAEFKKEIQKIEKKLTKSFSERDYDPSHKVYITLQNHLSLFADECSALPEFRKFALTYITLEEEYSPGDIPFSSISMSYFEYWALCDFSFGKSETISTIYYDLFSAAPAADIMVKGLEQLNASSMSFYVHEGYQDHTIKLREILTDQTCLCIFPSGYRGEKGDILFTRIVSNLDDIYDYKISITSPYVDEQSRELDYLNYYRKNQLTTATPNLKNKMRAHFKNHPDLRYWLNYLSDYALSCYEDRITLERPPKKV